MKYIRSILAVFCFFIFGIGAVILNFLLFPFIKNNKELCSDIIHNTWRFFVNLMMFLKLFRLDVKKLEKIENKVIVSTHPSFIDIVILIALIPRSTCFVKKELAHNPILKNLVTSIFITNEVELDELKSESKKMLDRGFNVIIFPSGIRHRRDEFPKIRKGASLVALNAGKNIVPIKMFSDRDFLFINQPFYAVSDRCVNFEIEQMREINIADFIGESEIITKQRLTHKIEEELYGL
ncbi:phospholipid/glycerol acyltransferase [Acinetobacter sp. CAG:196]|jgi:1-acyl-sn-glycerol-3-phosphate acyltransferase|nr:phospholipid/glycerol acyltransferase [Acinetobacter sp. CAG:196]DAB12574.1 MAG TPA: 1-acyl-sn-glycerol-3-phosphate acyltransferase [Candidatus Gastranaerophilales bacterium HUM_18]